MLSPARVEPEASLVRTGSLHPAAPALLALLAIAAPAPRAVAAEKQRRVLQVDDELALKEVEDPRISPDGRWIAYTVTGHDLEKDESRTRIWMVPASGGEAHPLTAPDQDSTTPRWSPDGRYLAFLSSRSGDGEEKEEKTQVYTLFREGGEAVAVTDTPQKVEFFAWSPDGKRMLLVLKDPKPEELAARQAREKGEKYEKK